MSLCRESSVGVCYNSYIVQESLNHLQARCILEIFAIFQDPHAHSRKYQTRAVMLLLRRNVVNCLTRSSACAYVSKAPVSSLHKQKIPELSFHKSFSHSSSIHKSPVHPAKLETPVPPPVPAPNASKSSGKQDQRKPGRNNAVKTSSLRRVAVEAQRSRGGFVRGKGNKRFVDPEVETKVRIMAICHIRANTRNCADGDRILRSGAV